jgi:hypothetical protein
MANLQEEELHAVFVTCGITDQATSAQMIAREEGFINLAPLGKLESDIDITEVAKRMVARVPKPMEECIKKELSKSNNSRLLSGGFMIHRREDLPSMQLTSMKTLVWTKQL